MVHLAERKPLYHYWLLAMHVVSLGNVARPQHLALVCLPPLGRLAPCRTLHHSSR